MIPDVHRLRLFIAKRHVKIRSPHMAPLKLVIIIILINIASRVPQHDTISVDSAFAIFKNLILKIGKAFKIHMKGFETHSSVVLCNFIDVHG
jgi:hypothetical protein